MRIMWRLALLLLLIVACDGKTGPVGPAGPAGEKGAGEVTILTGTLAYAKVASDYWTVTITGGNLNDAAITVHVRPGSTYAWEEPTWSFDSSHVFIFDDDNAGPGYQYRIAVVI